MDLTKKTVLFLCTGNSARSILAEAILNNLGHGRFLAYSAGSKPTGAPHPLALEQLESHGIDTGFASSKSWDIFAGPAAPNLDIIFTVCDSAAAEICPYWPGHPMTAHWGIPDPAATLGALAQRQAAFVTAYASLTARIQAFLALDIDSVSPAALKSELIKIGQDTK